MTSLLLLGFLIGMRHALEADHVAAIASLATQNHTIRQTVHQGIMWGFGHTITLFVFGSSVIWMSAVMPEKLAHGLEAAVGLMLILLGLDVMRRLYLKRVHFHVHGHADGSQHYHAHAHATKTPHNPQLHRHTHQHPYSLRALYIGLMHGMAGSAALILLTLESVQSPAMAMLYIALFGAGSICGMAILSVVIAIPLRKSASGLTWLHNGLQLCVGLATITLGCLLVFENSAIYL
jgi:High-affinity nickel-transport protein